MTSSPMRGLIVVGKIKEGEDSHRRNFSVRLFLLSVARQTETRKEERSTLVVSR